MTLDQLRALIASGEFHHATYRDIGTIWEGLWIYKRSQNGRGFEPVACFAKHDADLEAAFKIVAPTGPSLGSFGRG